MRFFVDVYENCLEIFVRDSVELIIGNNPYPKVYPSIIISDFGISTSFNRDGGRRGGSKLPTESRSRGDLHARLYTYCRPVQVQQIELNDIVHARVVIFPT